MNLQFIFKVEHISFENLEVWMLALSIKTVGSRFAWSLYSAHRMFKSFKNKQNFIESQVFACTIANQSPLLMVAKIRFALPWYTALITAQLFPRGNQLYACFSVRSKLHSSTFIMISLLKIIWRSSEQNNSFISWILLTLYLQGLEDPFLYVYRNSSFGYFLILWMLYLIPNVWKISFLIFDSVIGNFGGLTMLSIYSQISGLIKWLCLENIDSCFNSAIVCINLLIIRLYVDRDILYACQIKFLWSGCLRKIWDRYLQCSLDKWSPFILSASWRCSGVWVHSNFEFMSNMVLSISSNSWTSSIRTFQSHPSIDFLQFSEPKSFNFVQIIRSILIHLFCSFGQ